MTRKHIVVVGAGLGGLATALRVAHRGHRVTVLEKTDQVGGRNRRVRVGECEFDGGPTLMMMLDPFRKLFADVGERLEDHLELSLCDPNYRVFFQDGTRLDCTSNTARMVAQLREKFGAEAAARYPGFIGRLGDLYHASMGPFVRRNYDSPLDLASPQALAVCAKHGMLGNLAKGVAREFSDPRLRALFCLQTMYLGLSPYDAPWVYAVLVYMEYGEGVWYPKGGMVEIGHAVARLAEARGAEIRLNAPVAKVEGKRVVLESGETIEADAVVCNADLPYAERELLGDAPPKAEARRYSCSAYMMYIDHEGEIPELLHHNIVLGRDFEGNLEQIFQRHEIPDDPAFYAALSRKADPPKAPAGHENLFLLVPCPNLGHDFTEADARTIQDRVFGRLERETSFDRGRIRGMKTTTPYDWAGELNLDRGAAFGLSHDLMQSICFRPSNRSKTHPGVYFVGASTVPGNGLPMVLISAELAEERLVQDRIL
ncbi:MAG: phytoene desaturase family protein [Fimbriimonas sp.]